MCGVVGMIFDKNPHDMAQSEYTGLFHLQHRGQDSCGIAVERPDGSYKIHKNPGTLDRVFLGINLNSEAWCGYLGIGQVRYSTSGVDFSDPRSVEEAERAAQPLRGDFRGGSFFVAYNGNLVPDCVRELEEELGRAAAAEGILEKRVWVDTELIVKLVESSKELSFERALVDDVCPRLRGAFCLIFLYKGALYAVRDPWGFRPLELGRNSNGYLVASEDCVFDKFPGGEKISAVEPGECVILGRAEDGIEIRRFVWKTGRVSTCLFECVYYSRPDSSFISERAAVLRKELGRGLARECPPPPGADMVIGVPDSGVAAAYGYAMECGVPFNPMALLRLHGTGRTFIEPANDLRKKGVEYKLAAVRELVAGKKIVVVDDSVVRGNVISRTAALLKGNGAAEVHLRVSSPPVRHGCWYGIDTWRVEEELVARGVPDEEEILRKINQETAKRYGDYQLDSLKFLSLDETRRVGGGVRLCDACWTGNYPVK